MTYRPLWTARGNGGGGVVLPTSRFGVPAAQKVDFFEDFSLASVSTTGGVGGAQLYLDRATATSTAGSAPITGTGGSIAGGFGVLSLLGTTSGDRGTVYPNSRVSGTAASWAGVNESFSISAGWTNSGASSVNVVAVGSGLTVGLSSTLGVSGVTDGVVFAWDGTDVLCYLVAQSVWSSPVTLSANPGSGARNLCEVLCNSNTGQGDIYYRGELIDSTGFPGSWTAASNTPVTWLFEMRQTVTANRFCNLDWLRVQTDKASSWYTRASE